MIVAHITNAWGFEKVSEPKQLPSVHFEVAKNECQLRTESFAARHLLKGTGNWVIDFEIYSESMFDDLNFQS